MGVCVPKHIVCGWYTPNFVEGPTPCTLLVTPETRARLAAGGSFFRSIGLGLEYNNIDVTCTWQVEDSPGVWRDYDVGDTFEDLGRVKLDVTNGAISETYYQAQTYTTGTPGTWSSAIPGLRTQLNSSALVTMPSTDATQPWNSGTDDGDYLAQFSGSLSGGTGAPIDQPGRDAIRTGPAMTLVHISNTEDGSGAVVGAGFTKYWNGACWKAYDPNTPDCADPNNPPTDCHLGPASDC